MLIEDVKKLDPYQRLCYWIKEREKVRLAKEAGKSKPWTDDEIIQTYKFTNVRRMDDRVSQWLYQQWYKVNYDHPNMIIAATLARQLNNPESLGAIGFPYKWNPTRVEKILNNRASNGLRNFSAAYMITGTLGGTKVQQIVWKVVDALVKNKPTIDTSSMEVTATNLLSYAGFSDFISGQVVADMRWAVEGTWNDKHTWAPIGPGSRRGMNILLGRDIEASFKKDEFVIELRKLIQRLKKSLPTTIISRLEAIDYQNCLCEISGYEKVLWQRGRKKQLYQGKV